MNEELKSYLVDMEERINAHADKNTAELTATVSAFATHVDNRFGEIAPVIGKIENHENRIQFLEEKLA